LAVAFFDAATYVVSAVLVSGSPSCRWRERPPRVRPLRAAVAGFRDELLGGGASCAASGRCFANTLCRWSGALHRGNHRPHGRLRARRARRCIGYPANYAPDGRSAWVTSWELAGLHHGAPPTRLLMAWLSLHGPFTALLAATGNVLAAAALMFGTGIANMVFVIPTQTLFQERTPETMLGRVLGSLQRCGPITLAIVSGYLATLIGVAASSASATALAGLLALAHPAVRRA
jgi:hypothetical protein